MLTLIGRCQHTTHCSIAQYRCDLQWLDCLWATSSANGNWSVSVDLYIRIKYRQSFALIVQYV